jgi:hypothetical protein
VLHYPHHTWSQEAGQERGEGTEGEGEAVAHAGWLLVDVQGGRDGYCRGYYFMWLLSCCVITGCNGLIIRRNGRRVWGVVQVGRIHVPDWYVSEGTGHL